MEKDTIQEVVNDLKAKRDALSLAHEQLKKDNDDWNKCIIVLSLMTGMFESMKIKMGWDSSLVALVPIALSSIIASISALIKFKKFPEQMETLIQATSLLTNTLNKSRNHGSLDHEILLEYHDALEKLETSVYPDIRKKYLKMSQKNLIDIMKIEQTYFKNIELVNKGEKVQNDDDSSKKPKMSFIPNPLATRQDSSISTNESNKDVSNKSRPSVNPVSSTLENISTEVITFEQLTHINVIDNNPEQLDLSSVL